MLTIKKETKDGVITLALEGRLDTNTAPELEGELKDVNSGDLVFDLAKLDYISSAGLRVFLSVQKRIKSAGSMKLINVIEDVMEIFEVTGFTDILDIE